MERRQFLQLIAAAGMTHALPARAQRPSGIMAPVLTRNYDNARTGCNPNEIILNQANAGNLRQYFQLPMEGDGRGSESQILVCPSVPMDDGTTRDVALISCMNGLVYAFDANYSDIEWVKKASVPVNGSKNIDGWMTNDHWSFISTGVVDPDTYLWYGVAWSDPNGAYATAQYQLHCYDIRTGNRVGRPVQVTGSSQGQNFTAMMRKQRSSLLLATLDGKKTIFFACGTVSESSNGAAGYIVAYDIATAKLTSFLALTQGEGAGIWMAGGGLVCDGSYIYAVTGNGGFDGVNNFGESIVKVAYHNSILSVVAGWAPWTDSQREGNGLTLSAKSAKSPKLAGISAPSEKENLDDNAPVNVMHMKKRMSLVLGSDSGSYGGWFDEDLGSGGLTLVDGYLICAGKDGIVYVADTRNFPSTKLADLANPAANYAKLASPPIWATDFPGYQFNPAPQDPTTLDFLPGGKTRHNHSTPVSFLSAINGRTVFFWGENSPLRAFKFLNGAFTYLAQGNEIASANVTNSPGGMPGGFMTISYSPSIAGSAVVWGVIPYGNANTGDNGTGYTYGRLLGYDAEHFTNGTINVLFDSQKLGVPFRMNKFCVPTIDGGKVLLPTYGDTSIVFGL